MTRDEWIQKFNEYVSERMQNLDDDVFMEIAIAERYLLAFGVLPSDPEQLERVSKAAEIYNEVVALHGDFPII